MLSLLRLCIRSYTPETCKPFDDPPAAEIVVSVKGLYTKPAIEP